MKPESLWTVWKLRIQLWWMFGFEDWKNGTTSNHRLWIRWTKGVNYWRWVCVVRGHGHFTLGDLRQWTLQEALALAARKAEWVLHPDQEPVKEPEPNPTPPNHQKVYRLLDNGHFRVECMCGWISDKVRCHAERTALNWCAQCRSSEYSYVEHETSTREKSGGFCQFRQQEVSGMTMMEPETDRGPWIAHQVWTKENPETK